MKPGGETATVVYTCHAVRYNNSPKSLPHSGNTPPSETSHALAPFNAAKLGRVDRLGVVRNGRIVATSTRHPEDPRLIPPQQARRRGGSPVNELTTMSSSLEERAVANVRAEVIRFASNATDSGLANTSGARIFSDQMQWRLSRKALIARMGELSPSRRSMSKFFDSQFDRWNCQNQAPREH